MLSKSVKAGLLLLIWGYLPGQDSLLVTPNFKFREGLYADHDSFRRNAPTLPLDSVELEYFVNPQTLVMQVARVRVRGSEEEVDAGGLYAIVLEGMPYLRVPQREIQKPLPAFAALRVRGKIGYLSYPVRQTVEVPIVAYNPRNGRPFLHSRVKRERENTVERMLDFHSGRRAPFSVENFLRWIADDAQLTRTVQELSPREREEKLFKCLLIYNDRHPVFVPQAKKDDNAR